MKKGAYLFLPLLLCAFATISAKELPVIAIGNFENCSHIRQFPLDRITSEHLERILSDSGDLKIVDTSSLKRADDNMALLSYEDWVKFCREKGVSFLIKGKLLQIREKHSPLISFGVKEHLFSCKIQFQLIEASSGNVLYDFIEEAYYKQVVARVLFFGCCRKEKLPFYKNLIWRCVVPASLKLQKFILSLNKS